MTCCFDIGGSFIRYGLNRSDGLVVEHGRVPTPGHDFDAFVDALRDAITSMGAAPSVDVSISLAGIFDPLTGRSIIANVPCCHDRELATDLEAALQRPVRITNDADCYALAEATLGSGRGHANVFAIILGTGVGGGVVINSRLVTGKGGVAGEWGHGPSTDPTAGGLIDGFPPYRCGCGQTGCLDTIGGARGIERVHQSLHGVSLDSTSILALWREKDAEASKTISVVIEHLARSLSVIINTLGTSVVPVGGGLASDPEFVAALDQRVRRLTLAEYSKPLVVPGERRTDGGLVGAGLVTMPERIVEAV